MHRYVSLEGYARIGYGSDTIRHRYEINSVGSSSDGNTSNHNGEHGDNDNTPLWKYVKKLEKDGKVGGNTSFQCNYCQKTFKGSYFRVKSHLLKLKGNGVASCTKVTNSHLMEMEKVVEEAELRVKMAQLRDVPLPTSKLQVKEVQVVVWA
ncbi:hypothetical protein L3X38_011117 [Prunus dulcis]|uniref:BED-type domain-containing protein n=1 Tax=Prunus dulcis TaxID=3755 RepID=A0AAD4WHI2_PRUDU|nr:hypothetical protein L3X38_011117 [Prunus dulcis]